MVEIAGKKRVWPWMLVSYFIPIIGGLIIYSMKKDKEKSLAKICLLSTFVLPLTAGIQSILMILSLMTYDEYFILWSIATNGYLIYWITFGLLLSLYLLKSAFKDNEYKYFFLVFWFSLFGAVYSYYHAYKNDKNLRHNVGWFLFFQILIMAFLIFLILGLPLILSLFSLGIWTISSLPFL
jgi:hypothetical protein